MNLSYRFYKRTFFKCILLSAACVVILAERFRDAGNTNGAPVAMATIGGVIIVANAGLFVVMQRAKRREEAEALQATNSRKRRR
jgi:hypothetical protein